MSYTKHFITERALEEFKYEKNLVAFLALLSKKSDLDLDSEISFLIEKVNLVNFSRDLLRTHLNEAGLAEKKLSAFKKVSEEQLLNYLTDTNYLLEGRQCCDFIQSEGINDLVCKIFDFKEKDSVIDLGSGLGSFISYASKNYEGVFFNGIEINKEIFIISNILLELNEVTGNLINDDIFNFEPAEKYNGVFSLPPFQARAKANLGDYEKQIESRLGEKIGRLEIAVILKALDLVSDDGKAIFCLPQGMLFSNGHEKLLRKYLIENKYVETVIEMPSGTFYPYTMINTALVVLSKKENAKIHFINATSIFSKTRRGSNGLFLEDAKKIHGEYLLSEEGQSVFSKYVPYQEVVENDYLFTSNKYFLEEKIKIAGVKEYKKLGELAKITRGVQYKSDELDQKETALPSGNFYLSVKNIKDNEIDDELFYLDCIEEKYSNLILQENDILLGMVISDTAKIVLVKDLEDKKIIPASNLYIIRADKDAINPVFLKVLLESKNALEVFQGFSANAKALPSIKADFLNNLQIPIIPAEEQLRIAEKYEKMEAEKKRLKAEMNKLLTEKDNLISDFEAQNYICSVKTH